MNATRHFVKLFLYLKDQYFRPAMECDFINVVAAASHAVPKTVGLILENILDYL